MVNLYSMQKAAAAIKPAYGCSGGALGPAPGVSNSRGAAGEPAAGGGPGELEKSSLFSAGKCHLAPLGWHLLQLLAQRG